MSGPTGSRWAVVLATVLAVSLAVGVTAFSGAAAADMPDASQCSAISWSTQDLSGETYYEVDTLDKLQCIDSQGLGDNYVLTRDINASNTSTWDSGNGFEPLGGEFTGTFDGDNHTITGLTISRGGTDDVGLFSVVGSAGTVRNVGLEGGPVSGGERVGQLAGFNNGTVEDSHATGEVIGTERVGGLVGRSDGTMHRSYASGEHTRGTDTVGGLVGLNQGIIRQSYAARAVVATGGGFDGTDAGGLVGTSTGPLEDSYATGTASGSWNVGGLVGGYQEDLGGRTRRSYATGALSISDETQGIGGLVGTISVTDTTVENSYWDVGTTNEASAVGNEYRQTTVTGSNGFGATADSTPAPEMQGASAVTNMTNLSFQDTWETVEGEDPDAVAEGYPILHALDRQPQLQAQGLSVPTVDSIRRNSTASQETSADSVEFTVAFSESVTQVSTDDFSLSGTATGTVERVSRASGSTITVTVGSVSGDGSLGLDLDSNGDVLNSDGNSLNTTEPGTDETYTIDNTGPAFVSSENHTVPENTVDAVDVNATDGNGNDTDVTYSLVGGVDQSAFSINTSTGSLSFNSTPNFENATDADRGNDYVVDVQAADGVANTNIQTLTVDVTDVDESRPRRSRSSSSNDDPDVRVTANDGGAEGAWTVDVSDPSTDEPVEISLGDAADNDDERDVSLTGLRMNVDDGSDFELDITTGEAGSDEAEQSFTAATGSESMGTITVDHTIADENIEDVTFTVTLRKSRLADSGLDPESVALYRDESTRWNRLSTTVVVETDSQYTFEATSPGLSTFVIGAAPAATPQPETTDDESATNTTDTPNTPSETATTDDESPGFGIGLTGVAVLVSGFVARLVGRRADWYR